MRTSTRFYALFAAALLTLAGCDERSISAPLQTAPGTLPAPTDLLTAATTDVDNL
jgi:hypothetical protein